MPGNPLTDPNWANDVADQITTYVEKVRDATTNNAIKAVRAVVFGLLALFLGLTLIVLLLVGITRAVQALFSLWVDWDTAVYVSYFFVGGLLTLVGMLLMAKRTS